MDLSWHRDELRCDNCVVVRGRRDTKYPNMWRVVEPDTTLSDMVNRTRAKDAAELRVGGGQIMFVAPPSLHPPIVYGGQAVNARNCP